MTQYFIRRVIATVVVIWFSMTLIFIGIRLMPGDITLAQGGERPSTMSPEQREHIRKKLGLDKPIYIQYINYFVKVIHGDLGISFQSKRPVFNDVIVLVPRTAEMAFSGLIVGIIIGIPAGIVCAVKQNGWIDTIINAMLVLFGSLPVYVSGIALIFIFGLKLGWVPTGGFVKASDNLGEHLRLLLLPSTTLGLWLGAITARMTRSSLLEVLSQDYIRTAFAKGVSTFKVYVGHALKNALIPVVTSIGLQVGSLLGGAVLTETVFTWPGLGKTFVSAVLVRDYTVIQGVVMVSVSAFVVTNMIIDIGIGFLDPRIVFD
ncbi:MAG: ABC transporter permease [Anaerolineales bacterium]|nr:ABC transporter permease [Anaerolineales bacterium]